MKNILFVAHENTKGGATHSLINLLDYLPKNITPFVLIPKTLGIKQSIRNENRDLYNAGTLKQELVDRNIKFFEAYYFFDNLDIKQNILKKNAFELIRNKEINRILSEIKKNNIELIHSNSSVVKIGADLAKKGNLKHIWHVRENIKFMFDVTEKGFKKYAFNILENADNIIFVSEKLKEEFKSYIGHEINYNEEKLLTIYNGIPFMEDKIIRESDKLTFDIYCFSTIYSIKGQEDLVNLAIMMRDNGIENFKIHLVGQKKVEYYKYLKNLIFEGDVEEFIIFHGYINDAESIRVNADVEIVCSRNEAFGRVAVEAMSIGNPLIVTSVGGLNEIVSHGINGFKYEPGDINKLYEYVTSIMFKRVDIKTIVEKGKERASDFHIINCVNKICELY